MGIRTVEEFESQSPNNRRQGLIQKVAEQKWWLLCFLPLAQRTAVCLAALNLLALAWSAMQREEVPQHASLGDIAHRAVMPCMPACLCPSSCAWRLVVEGTACQDRSAWQLTSVPG
uniref:Uncharacterized protein n=1 Tax=Eutreptiella gymnastica TaxID=73025 RepID=A0A7S4LLY2_9EUGL